MSTPAPEGGPHQHPEVEQNGTSNPAVDPIDPPVVEEPDSSELTEEQKKIAANAARGIYGSAIILYPSNHKSGHNSH